MTDKIKHILISSLADLCKIGKNKSTHPLNGHYELTNDIDASKSRDLDNGRGFMPIGWCEPDELNKLDQAGFEYWRYGFTGVFDGNNHTIENLYINRPNGIGPVGMFGLATGAEIKNVNISGNFTGNTSTDGIAGQLSQKGKIINCSFSGEISGKESVGGLIGFGSNITITKSHVSGAVRGTVYVGGLLGCCTKSKIDNCYLSASVNGSNILGILAGDCDRSKLNSCYSTANANISSNVSGLIGRCDSNEINNCYWDSQKNNFTNMPS